ncbi:GNAT family N-acetyltransferase [Sphingomonas sp.]|jgi:putative acetyltransferase|uniref:GNAT family N-acetyltransferase n=1 Tax=Sphingomonas sp. TaxID=28214 RepID=UPI002ED91DFD
MIEVRVDDPASPAVAAMIARHFADAHANSPPGFRFVLGPEKLAQPDVTFFSAWDGDALAGMGAIKDSGCGNAEVKSMRTEPAHRRKGVGAAVLARIVAGAREAGLTRLSLETGTGEDFAPARALYLRAGFVDCAAFADYPADSPHNCYMTLEL